jgi:hypothetical protein
MVAFGLVDRYQCFRGTFFLHLHGRRLYLKPWYFSTKHYKRVMIIFIALKISNLVFFSEKVNVLVFLKLYVCSSLE